MIPSKYQDKLYNAETRMILLPDSVNRTIVSLFVWSKHRNVTEGRTDRQTGRRTDLLWLLQRTVLDADTSELVENALSRIYLLYESYAKYKKNRRKERQTDNRSVEETFNKIPGSESGGG